MMLKQDRELMFADQSIIIILEGSPDLQGALS